MFNEDENLRLDFKILAFVEYLITTLVKLKYQLAAQFFFKFIDNQFVFTYDLN